MVCTFFILTDTLVGGDWAYGLSAGLWYWNVNEASSIAWTTVGARLLIKNIINIRDMVCRALVLSVVVLLSAVEMLPLLTLVFGVGWFVGLLQVLTLASVLDLLYRDLVC